ncbi:MAG: DNA translocase FtsK, partial [Planctomycetaceae bacterium]|nr:DNA translocase FtsK [Planctomycetaceae bacterium]
MQDNFRPEGMMVILGSLFLAGLFMSSDTISRGIAFNILRLPRQFFEPVPPTKTKQAAPVKLNPIVFTTDTAEAPPPPPAPKPAKKKISFFSVGFRAEPDETDDLESEAVAVTETFHADSPVEYAPRPVRINPPRTSRPSPQPVDDDSDDDYGDDYEERPLPTPDLLDEAEEFPYELLAEKAKVAAATLERTFKEFGLNIRVVEIDTGPVITQFELELEAGLRLSKVSALADDLAIALRVPSVRVVAPIPGKNTVGVEVPNDKQVMVRLRELIESCGEDAASKRIPIFLGKDVTGRPLVVDLTKMPHLLIAGRTGTGKSVCLNTLILSILMTRTPEQVKMLMVDPKMVELSPYTKIPHLMNPVITDMKKAEAVLAWAVDKMEERYDLLAQVGVRHLDSYNKLGKDKVLDKLGIDPDSEEAEGVPERMPYIVIIADEMADLMMTAGKDVEQHIIRLAQKSRAVGIHLILATQKP